MEEYFHLLSGCGSYSFHGIREEGRDGAESTKRSNQNRHVRVGASYGFHHTYGIEQVVSGRHGYVESYRRAAAWASGYPDPACYSLGICVLPLVLCPFLTE